MLLAVSASKQTCMGYLNRGVGVVEDLGMLLAYLWRDLAVQPQVLIMFAPLELLHHSRSSLKRTWLLCVSTRVQTIPQAKAVYKLCHGIASCADCERAYHLLCYCLYD